MNANDVRIHRPSFEPDEGCPAKAENVLIMTPSAAQGILGQGAVIVLSIEVTVGSANTELQNKANCEYMLTSPRKENQASIIHNCIIQVRVLFLS